MTRDTAAPPRVCILIVNYNGWEDTAECLESVLRLRYPSFQVVVCDNDSPNDSVTRIEGWARGELEVPRQDPRLPVPGAASVAKPVPLELLGRDEAERGRVNGDPTLVVVQTGENAGFAAGNNVGVRFAAARGADYVWLLNPDTVVHPDSLGALVAEAEADPRLGVVGGRILYYGEPERTQAAAGGTLSHWRGTTRLCGDGAPADAPLRPGGELAYVHGACLLARMAAVRAVGEMDERYFLYSEEVDWCLRMRRAGWRLGYAPGCRVWHKEGRSVRRQSALQEYHILRSRMLLMRTHFPSRYPFALVYTFVRSMAVRLARLDAARARVVVSAFRDHLSQGARPAASEWSVQGE